jgi:hypothetical protein
MGYADASFDACVSALAIDVIPEVDQVVGEMQWVTRGGGTVASSVFDFWGGFSPADLVCDTASVLDEGMRSLRDQRKARRIAWANGQAAIWRETGLVDPVEVPIVISFDYASFEDYWSSFSMTPSPIGQCVAALPAELHSEVERHVHSGYLAGLSDGPRSFATIVRVVREHCAGRPRQMIRQSFSRHGAVADPAYRGRRLNQIDTPSEGRDGTDV